MDHTIQQLYLKAIQEILTGCLNTVTELRRQICMAQPTPKFPKGKKSK